MALEPRSAFGFVRLFPDAKVPPKWRGNDMRILMAGMTLAVLTLSTHVALAATPSDETLSYCKTLSEMAGSIMKNRQDEMPMAEMMKVIAGGEPDLAELGAVITKDAYSTSAFRTAEDQKIAVSEFKEKWFSLCVKVRNKRQL
ncbi:MULTISPECIES: hypothetical protein [unclassified Pseudomonas]|uniref:hypothetical protein n=1 Tax=unclassified Pseudomonas TaxID=196821 RepID=UPI0015C10715|nr:MULTISPECIES: hypothetical protein [unclassified Pseudomonas]NWC92600.1 hypothetical protein [Pseudomonas sp. IPO3779]NWD15598.1 hypothetical protein [Pseudomonas sp. IPO3778]